MAHKKLYRSTDDKVFAGVCGGLAEYFDVDSPLLRLALVIIILFTGFFPGVLLYILAIFLIPTRFSRGS